MSLTAQQKLIRPSVQQRRYSRMEAHLWCWPRYSVGDRSEVGPLHVRTRSKAKLPYSVTSTHPESRDGSPSTVLDLSSPLHLLPLTAERSSECVRIGHQDSKVSQATLINIHPI